MNLTDVPLLGDALVKLGLGSYYLEVGLSCTSLAKTKRIFFGPFNSKALALARYPNIAKLKNLRQRVRFYWLNSNTPLWPIHDKFSGHSTWSIKHIDGSNLTLEPINDIGFLPREAITFFATPHKPLNGPYIYGFEILAGSEKVYSLFYTPLSGSVKMTVNGEPIKESAELERTRRWARQLALVLPRKIYELNLFDQGSELGWFVGMLARESS